uniref:Ceramide synthase 1 n=1 Tax=Lates calcarifer TaxID=8187 RepID=A0A4W6FXY5_LATCA
MSVPTDIAIAYLIQGSFYGHSIYATVYMDAWRKDSAVMVVHHIITLALISFSYAFRYHNVGILVLFLHDINDIQLEFTKLNVYLKSRGGGYHLLNDILSNMGSVSFSITWFWFRLYWFPLKVLYATCVSSPPVCAQHPLLLLLQRSSPRPAAHEHLLVSGEDTHTQIHRVFIQNLNARKASVCLSLRRTATQSDPFVFPIFLPSPLQFIVIFVVKVLKMKEVNDVREYEDEDGSKAAAGLHRAPQAANNDDGAGHHNSAQGKHVQNGVTKEKHL